MCVLDKDGVQIGAIVCPGPPSDYWQNNHPVTESFPTQGQGSGLQPREQASSCLPAHHCSPLAGNFILLLFHPSHSYSSSRVKPNCCLPCGVLLNSSHQLNPSHVPPALCYWYQSSLKSHCKDLSAGKALPLPTSLPPAPSLSSIFT